MEEDYIENDETDIFMLINEECEEFDAQEERKKRMFDLICFIIGMIIITIFILSILIFILQFISPKNEIIITAICMLICLLLFIASFIIGVLIALAYR